MIDPLYLLIVGVVGVLGCGLVAFFGWRVFQEERAQKDKEARREAIAAQALEAVTPAAAPKASGLGEVFGAFTAKASAPGAHEVLRVLRDHLTGRLVIEVGGKRYQSLNEIQDAALREGVLTNVRDLQAFVGGAALPAPTPSTEPAAAGADWLVALRGTAVPTPPAPAARLAPDRAEARRAEIARPETPKPVPAAPPPTAATSATPMPGTPAKPGAIPMPSMNPFKQMEVLRELAKNQPPPPKTIPEEIDEILQAKVNETVYAQRGVKVSLGPKGGVRFELDGKSYEGVDEIPDATVRALVKEAVSEWEKRK